MVKSGLASPLFLCKYPQENITIQNNSYKTGRYAAANSKDLGLRRERAGV